MAKKETVTRILNCIPSADTENDWTIENALESGALTVSRNPNSIDLREDWWQIGDQGSTGSCVGWATADSVIRWHYVKDNSVTEKELLSVRFIWMAAKETDEFISRPTTFIESAGTSLKAALDVARKFGCVLDTALPFDPCDLYQKSAFTFYSLAAQLKIAGYFNLGTSLNEWRSWLANNGPILTRLGVDATWDNATDTQGKLDVYKSDTQRGGHAIALVGYTPDTFIVRNSWGTAWGDKGFAYASESYASEAFTEAYGVMM
jgi:C1A family cysteine protease